MAAEVVVPFDVALADHRERIDVAEFDAEKSRRIAACYRRRLRQIEPSGGPSSVRAGHPSTPPSSGSPIAAAT